MFIKIFSEIAQNILQSNIYMTLATTNKNGRPWAAPVYFCADEQNNLYFISSPKSRHMENVKYKNDVAFAIFDSHQPEGTGNGIQGTGTIKKLTNVKLLKGLKYYHTSFITVVAAMFQGKAHYRLYKLTPKTFYILDPNAKVDTRVEVRI